MAAADYFLCIAGIKGESHDAAMKAQGCIDLESYSWGAIQTGTSASVGGGGAGRAVAQDFCVTMKINKATPDLMQACATGRHFPSAEFIARKAGGKQEAFFVVKMTDLLVSAYHAGGLGYSDIVPAEQICLNFAKVEFVYQPQDEKGAVGSPIKGGYDFKANKKL